MRRLALAIAAAALVLVGTSSCSGEEAIEGATTLEVAGTPLHAIVREGPRRPGAVVTVLLLHGQAYTSRIWQERGILDAVAGTGHRAVAVDLPGFGESPERSDDPGERAAFLEALIDELGGPGEVVLVSPSRSGDWSLPYLALHPDEALVGFVPIAPVGIEGFDRAEGASAIPTISVWGADDGAFSPERADRLVEEMGGAPTARTEIIAGASHAAYDDHPEEFTALLLELLPTA